MTRYRQPIKSKGHLSHIDEKRRKAKLKRLEGTPFKGQKTKLTEWIEDEKDTRQLEK